METPRRPIGVGLGMTVGMMVVALAALMFVFQAPTAAPPEHLVIPRASTAAVWFDMKPLDRLSERYVDEVGMVDYEGLKKDHKDLDAFLRQVAEISPNNNIATFSSEEEALAYWINAYNAWMMKAVIDAYPTESVNDIGEDPGVFDVEDKTCGGDDLSLNNIENDIVRTAFLEPRVHFALNCASMSCPWLPQEAFDPKRLDEQLEREARRFFADPSHLVVDVETKTVSLTAILDWYQEDFLRWLTEAKGIEDPSVLDYVRLYAPEDVANQIGDDFSVEYLEYDWRLNDRNAEWAELRKPLAGTTLASEQ